MKVNPSAIAYGPIHCGRVPVYIGGKRCGEIRFTGVAYQYFPKGSKVGGEPFVALSLCKRSLEES